MPKKSSIRTSELRGMVSLLTHATIQVTDMTEKAHHSIVQPTALPHTPIHRMIRGISGLVFFSVKHISRFVGHGLDQILNLWHPHQETGISFAKKEEVLAITNGIVGDYLQANHNPLATPMQLRYRDEPLSLHSISLQTYPKLNGHLLLMLHGLCMNEVQWNRKGHNHGDQLASEFNLTPLYLRYNSGLHISDNGRMLSEQMEKLISKWPVPIESITFLTHSMGGLVARSAIYYAQKDDKTWPGHIKKMVFLGTPHFGAPLEKIGHHVHRLLEVHPYVKPFSRLGSVRSAGITDLRFGNVVEENWKGNDRFKNYAQKKFHIDLPERMKCYAVAACMGRRENLLNNHLLGDGLVPVESALGHQKDSRYTLNFAKENRKTVYQTKHLDLLNSDEVYQSLRTWFSG